MNIKLNIYVLLQAYAELEKDTPGQILGVTFKSDGKSTESESSQEKFTQRPKGEDHYYEEHDIKDTIDYKKNQIDFRTYFGFGFLIVFVLGVYLLNEKKEDFINIERDKTLARQQEKRDKTPFDEA